MLKIDQAIYHLEHHNKNLTKAQEEAVAAIKEYREGKYGFDDLANIAKENGLDGAVSYLEIHGMKEVYSKETLITFINAIFGALQDTDENLPGDIMDYVNGCLNTHLELLKCDFDGKERRAE